MLSREDNEQLTRVGAGTPCGTFMRRYWLPALLASEIPAPDCPPVRVRLLGEDLVAFRDTNGRIGLLEERCPHRQASLFLGRNEECGLRCVFHGWKLDVSGACVDMPNEPSESSFKDKIHQVSYPTAELGGVVWTFMGPLDKQPPHPSMEWLRASEAHRFVSKTWERCSYLQGIEGGIDTVHSSFLHNNDLANKGHFKAIDTAPRLEVERTEYGFRYAGIRDIGERGNYTRIYQFVLPFHQFRSQQVKYHEGSGDRQETPLLKGHMWVPMDDENTLVFNWLCSADADKPLTPEFIEKEETSAGRSPEWGETMVRRRTRENDWQIDRELQRTRTYTGIRGINTQDLAVQESMGPVADRTREHLGSTDRAIIMLRRILLEAIGDLSEADASPPGTDPRSYSGIRAADVVLPKDVPWQVAASDLLVAAQ